MLGGVGRYTAELARALQEQGAQVAVLTDRQAPAQGASGPEQVPVVAQAGGWGWRILKDIPARCREFGADWVHVQYQTAAYGMHPAINSLPYVLRRLARRAQGLRWQESESERPSARVAWTYHDLRVPYLFPKAGNRLRRWVTRLPLRVADAVVVTNEADWASAHEQKRPSPWLHRIPIGSDIVGGEIPDVERVRRRAARGFGKEDLLLGYFGFVNASKGGLTLIETLAVLVREGYEAHLLMIGEPVGASDETNFSYLRRVQALISEKGLGRRVHWTGHVSDAEVSAELNTIDVLVMPFEDGMSLRRSTLTAALANGCAIVTTHPPGPAPALVATGRSQRHGTDASHPADVSASLGGGEGLACHLRHVTGRGELDGCVGAAFGAMPELTPDSDLLLAPPRDPEATAAAVMRIAGDASLAEKLQENARRAARQFRWSAIAARHLEMYAL